MFHGEWVPWQVNFLYRTKRKECLSNMLFTELKVDASNIDPVKYKKQSIPMLSSNASNSQDFFCLSLKYLIVGKPCICTIHVKLKKASLQNTYKSLAKHHSLYFIYLHMRANALCLWAADCNADICCCWRACCLAKTYKSKHNQVFTQGLSYSKKYIFEKHFKRIYFSSVYVVV